MSRNFFRRVVSKRIRRSSAYDLIPPFEYVQNIVEHYLSDYLAVPKSDISSIFIVGGYLGGEIPRLLSSFPNCQITVFEPSQRYFDGLTRRFQGNGRVHVERYALAECEGVRTFTRRL